MTPANLNKFDKFVNHFTFGCSAVESGLMKGRQFGGVIALIHNNLRNITETVYCCERVVFLKLAII